MLRESNFTGNEHLKSCQGSEDLQNFISANYELEQLNEDEIFINTGCLKPCNKVELSVAKMGDPVKVEQATAEPNAFQAAISIPSGRQRDQI